jgi:exopolysaccharide biosynthesis polyprenyl glycosylphosphotransferase
MRASVTGSHAIVEAEPQAPAATASVPQQTAPKGASLDPSLLKQRLIVADALSVALGLSLAFAVQAALRADAELGVQRPHLVLAFVTFPVWIVSFSLNRLYQARAVERASEEFRRIVTSSMVSVGVILAVAFALQFKELSRLWIGGVLFLVPAVLVAERAVARRLFNKLRAAGRSSRPILIIGTDADAVGLMHAAQRSPFAGYNVVGFVGPDELGVRGGVRVLGGIEDTMDVLEATGATGVIISLSSIEPTVLNRLTRDLTDAGYHVALSSGMRDIDVVRFRAQDLGGQTLIYVEQTQRDGWRATAKRVFDVTVALVALVLTAPITIAAIIAIKVTSPGPVIFTQERIGRDGQPFRIHKFRTMVIDAEERKAELVANNEADGPLFKMSNDPRITKVGGLLRKLSIDEIPQFVNVLRGDMSVVGPRPALASEVAQWTDDVHERLRVLPGITGMWQVSGRSDTTFDEYKRLDLYYVDNWSLAHDLRIVVKTFSVVLAKRGAR